MNTLLCFFLLFSYYYCCCCCYYYSIYNLICFINYLILSFIIRYVFSLSYLSYTSETHNFLSKFVLFHDKILTTNGIIAHNSRFLETICVRVVWIKLQSAWSTVISLYHDYSASIYRTYCFIGKLFLISDVYTAVSNHMGDPV